MLHRATFLTIVLGLLSASAIAEDGSLTPKEPIGSWAQNPISVCSDATFLRRASIDVLGRLPTREELHSFVNDASANKRQLWIEHALNSEDCVKRWSNWFTQKTGCDEVLLKYAAGETHIAEEQLAVAWQEWIKYRIRDDRPWHEIIEGFLLATSREGQSRSEYYRWLGEWRASADSVSDVARLFAERKTNDLFWRRLNLVYDGGTRAEEIAGRFLGVRLECARCHDHPRDVWTSDNYKDFASVFQRVRYVEMPFTRSEKRRVLLGCVLACFTSVTVILIAWYVLCRHHWRRTATFLAGGSFLTLGVVCGQLPSYKHLFSSQFNPSLTSPGLMALESLSPLTGSHLIFTGSLLTLALLWLAVWVRKSEKTLVRSIASVLCLLFCGSVLGITADIYYLHTQESKSDGREVLAHYVHRLILRSVGWGGNETQPREILVADDYFREIGSPTLLDGTPVTSDPGIDPRSQLMTWIREGAGRELAVRSIVNMVWQEYFGSPLVDVFHTSDTQDKVMREELMARLSQTFLQNNWSLRSLHKSILQLPQYQGCTTEELSGSVHFQVRRLSSRQWISAVDQVTGSRTSFGGDYLAATSPWDVPALRIYEEPFAGASLQLFSETSQGRDFQTETAMFGLVDPTLQEKITDPGGRLLKHLNDKDDDLTILKDLYENAFSRIPTDEETESSMDYISQSNDRLSGWCDLYWAVLNSPEFQLNH